MKQSYLMAAASALALVLPAAAQATVITLPPTFNNNFYTYAYGDGFSSTPPGGPGTISYNAHSIDPVNHPATASGSLDVKSTPFPSITASASATGTGTAAVSGSLSYQFIILDASGVYNPANQFHVPTLVDYKGSASANSSNPSNSGATSSFLIAGTNFSDSYSVTTGAFNISTHISSDCCGAVTDPTFTGTSFSQHKLYDMIANTFYRIDLLATATDTFDGSASAYIDPYLQIDPSFAGQYHLEFSPGIDNFAPAAVAATPIPASLPMFGAALLGLGLVGYRTKRKRAITA